MRREGKKQHSPASGQRRPRSGSCAAGNALTTPFARRPASALLAIIALGVLGGGGWPGWRWWTMGRFGVSTDDACVRADHAILSPKVSGYVAAVRAEETAKKPESRRSRWSSTESRTPYAGSKEDALCRVKERETERRLGGPARPCAKCGVDQTGLRNGER
ncbi:MAG: hypothetical protein WD969_12635 [Paracoccaceae bacterium]